MKVAKVLSRSQFGLDSPLITIEVHISQGLPAFNIVGMPEVAVRESKDRVRSAIINSGFDFPAQRITVNLAPADVPKQGSRFDLAIAIGILVANGDLAQHQVEGIEFVAELSLSGGLRSVTGIVSSIIFCEKNRHQFIGSGADKNKLFFQPESAMFFLKDLKLTYQHLQGQTILEAFILKKQDKPKITSDTADIADVKGQYNAKRALFIAAAGRHNLLFYGPPGSGKTMLSSRIIGILPDLNKQQAFTCAQIYSSANKDIDKLIWTRPPYRKPHHSASPIAIVGGGRLPTPGEISLAHNGVLFLDEIAEFNRQVLEHLREPLESREISISRSQWKVTFPANIQLIAAMNPCPCGYKSSQIKECRCSEEMIARYQAKLSGPIRDRIDMIVHVDAMPIKTLIKLSKAKSHDDEFSSHRMKKRVVCAQAFQFKRQGKLNSELNNEEIETFCSLDDSASSMLEKCLSKMPISARVYFKILKIARTIADTKEKHLIQIDDITEAINFRRFEL